jgi:hypothetical protein
MRPISKTVALVITIGIVLGLLLRLDILTMDLDVGFSINSPSDKATTPTASHEGLARRTHELPMLNQAPSKNSDSDAEVLTIVIDKQSLSGRNSRAELLE